MSVEGLSSAEAAARLAARGPNEIRRDEAVPAWRVFAGQFTSVMPALLAGAALVSGLVGELGDAIAITAILVINAVVGFVQEHRAERAVLALRAMTAPRARVVRDGHATMIPAREVVAGDLLLLESGDIIAADGILCEAHRLSVDEATLTGESEPVAKQALPEHDDAGRDSIAEQPGRIFQGTVVATGSGAALVLATGMATQLGKIAHLLATTEQEETPLERRLAQVGVRLAIACGGIVVAIAGLGLLQGRGWNEVLVSSVSLAVAAVPEGLAAIVTIALALGVQRMAARHVLVRRLAAVEALGSTTVICTDKTGTLTAGVMAVREVWGEDHVRVLRCAAACCDAELGAGPGAGSGDPTELAILSEARGRGIERAAIEASAARVAVIPFDAERKRMAIARADGVLYVKGAIEVVLGLCGGDADALASAQAAASEMATRGLRVLAIATGRGEDERELELIGLVGLADPPRPEAIAAIAAARRAGVKTVMITGDHPVTARAIAREMGLVVAGEDEAERVHARATPRRKLELVQAWKARGEIVAMTGDGVNDAPALRAAHIGIAMGQTGTEVTREAADMILSDDNFASIVAAIREGRAIFDNIRKSLVYLLAGNTSELLVMLGAALLGLPVPLLPLQLLWINLVTDGLPALALVMDPPDDDSLARPPRRPDEPLLGRRQWRAVVAIGVLEASLVLAAYAAMLRDHDVTYARSVAFSVLVLAELLRAFASRSATRSLWQVGALSNLKLVGVVVISVLLQLGIHHIPATQALFRIVHLATRHELLALGLGLVPVTTLELAKLLVARWRRRTATA